ALQLFDQAIRRPEAPGATQADRREARAHRRLRRTDAGLAAVVLVALEDRSVGQQLGLGDHHRHDPDQARVLQAHGDERAFAREDAQTRAAYEDAARALQGRPPGAEPGD